MNSFDKFLKEQYERTVTEATMREFIQQNREAIDDIILSVGGKKSAIDDREREMWVMNHEPLYLRAVKAGAVKESVEISERSQSGEDWLKSEIEKLHKKYSKMMHDELTSVMKEARGSCDDGPIHHAKAVRLQSLMETGLNKVLGMLRRTHFAGQIARAIDSRQNEGIDHENVRGLNELSSGAYSKDEAMDELNDFKRFVDGQIKSLERMVKKTDTTPELGVFNRQMKFMRQQIEKSMSVLNRTY